MQCYLVRPFDIISRFWTYKITINGESFSFKGIGTKAIDIPQCEEYDIKVTTNHIFKQFTVLKTKEVTEGAKIKIKPRFTNWPYASLMLITLVVAALSIYFNNTLAVYATVFTYSLVGLSIDMMNRNKYFSIKIYK